MKIGLSSDTCLADRDVDDRVLEDPGPSAARSRRGERRRSGASGCSSSTSQSSRGSCGKYDVTVNDVMNVTADALDAGLLRYSDGAVIGTGGVLADARISRYRSATSCRSLSPEDLAKVVVAEQARQADPARRRRQGRDRPPAALGRRGDQRRSRAACSSSRSSRGGTRSTSPGGSRRRSRRCAGASRDRDRLHHLPARDLRRRRHRQPLALPAPGRPAHDAGAGRVPLRLAERADQRRDDPAVPHGCRRWSCTSGGPRSTRWSLPGS